MRIDYTNALPPKRKLAGHAPFIAAAVLTLAAASQAHANCKVIDNYNEKIIEMDMGDVVVDDRMVVGTVLKERTFSIPIINPDAHGAEVFAKCLLGGSTIGTVDQGTLTNIPDVYSTAVEGIGIRLTRHVGGGTAPAIYPHTLTYGSGQSPAFFPGAGFTVELLKTAEVVGSGELQKGVYTTYYANGTGVGRPIMTTRLIGNGITVTTPACTLDDGSKNISVDLGSVSTSTFTGPGSTSTAKSFEVKLNCVAKPRPQEIWMQFDAIADPNTTTDGVIQLTGGEGSASGVGIQVLGRNEQPVKLNTAWKDGVSAQGLYSMPFQAQYYQTQSVVQAGAANGVATFTITYK